MHVALLYVRVMPSQLLLKSGEKTTYLAALQCGPCQQSLRMCCRLCVSLIRNKLSVRCVLNNTTQNECSR